MGAKLAQVLGMVLGVVTVLAVGFCALVLLLWMVVTCWHVLQDIL